MISVIHFQIFYQVIVDIISRQYQVIVDIIWFYLVNIKFFVNFVDVFQLFLACLYNLQSQALLNDVETEKIFSNIADLQQHNCLFYETHMYKIVTTARSTGQPLDPTPLIQGFLEVIYETIQ